jgi:hypothetical protein
MRRSEPRIVDPATHPKRSVSLRVAAVYLEVDEKTLRKWLLNGLLSYRKVGRVWKIAVSEIIAFEARNEVRRA